MKPLVLALTPTRNRRVNEVTGMVLLVAASLLFLALASYHPTDPSLNTVGGSARQAHNWTGLIGATISDLLLQLEGVAAFFIPLMLGALGWTWLRSRPAGSPTAKISGVLLYLVFAPAVFGLIPGQLRWMHALPIEGLTGRLVGDNLVHYLNVPGAAIVIVSMVVISLYLSTTFSFSTAQQWMAVRFAFAYAWRDRLRNWHSCLGQSPGRKECHQARCHERQHPGENAEGGAEGYGESRWQAGATGRRGLHPAACILCGRERCGSHIGIRAPYPVALEPDAANQYSRSGAGSVRT